MTRIEALSQLTQGIDTLLDIGTDHGYVVIDAIQKGYIHKAIACDVNPKPLENARRNVMNSGLSNEIKVVLSDGFKNIEDTYDGVLIAGMGMHLAKNILSQSHTPAKKYILQVNNHVDELRLYLSNNQYKIVDEITVFDKFHYVIIVCEKGHMILNEKDLFVGPMLKNKKNALAYYENQMAILKRNFNKANGHKKQVFGLKISYLSEIIDLLI